MSTVLAAMEREVRAMEHHWADQKGVKSTQPCGVVECIGSKVLRTDGSRGMYGDTISIRWKLNGKVISRAKLEALT